MQLSQKQKTFSQFSAAIIKSKLNFEQFQTKMTLTVNLFPNYGLPKMRLDKYLKSTVAQYPSTSNIENVLKYCSNHHVGTFTISIDQCEGYWFRKVTLVIW